MPKLIAIDQGDPSVGIGQSPMEVDWPYELDDRDDREMARETVRRWYVELGCGIGRVRVYFEGECECCGAIGGHHVKCPEVDDG